MRLSDWGHMVILCDKGYFGYYEEMEGHLENGLAEIGTFSRKIELKIS